MSTTNAITVKHLAGEIAEKHGLTKKNAEAILTDLGDSFVKNLVEGNAIRWTGLGVFQVRHRAARVGRNPATGEQIQIAASKKIAFRPATTLKAACV
jgi:DNA-binding protein HU-beta